jgi:hypothetical protein
MLIFISKIQFNQKGCFKSIENKKTTSERGFFGNICLISNTRRKRLSSSQQSILLGDLQYGDALACALILRF